MWLIHDGPKLDTVTLLGCWEVGQFDQFLPSDLQIHFTYQRSCPALVTLTWKTTCHPKLPAKKFDLPNSLSWTFHLVNYVIFVILYGLLRSIHWKHPNILLGIFGPQKNIFIPWFKTEIKISIVFFNAARFFHCLDLKKKS